MYHSNMILKINNNVVYSENRGEYYFNDVECTRGTLTCNELNVEIVGAIFYYADNVSGSGSWTISDKHWLNINVLNPDGNEDYQSGYFDEYVSGNNKTYRNLTDQTDTTQENGTYVNVTNIRPYGDYYTLDRVVVDGTNKGAITSYKYTIGSRDGNIDIYMKYTSASKPSCITYPNTTQNIGNVGDTITIHMNRKSSSYTHTVKYSFGSTSGTIATGVTNNTSWTIPLDLAKQIPKNTSGTGNITVETYYGSKKIGTNSVSFTVKVPNNDTFKPDFTLSATPSNDFGGKYLNTYSGVTINITNVSTKYSATASSSSIRCLNRNSTSTSLAISVINTTVSSANIIVTYTAKVTDSRGYYREKTGTFTLYRYSKPTISAASIQRCNQDGTLNNDGTYGLVQMTYNISNDVGGNTAEIHRVRISSTDTDLTSGTPAVVGGSFSTTNSYTATFMVKDKVGNTSQTTLVLSTAYVTMDYLSGGKGVSIGKIAEIENLFDINLPTLIRNALRIGTLSRLTNADISPTHANEYGGIRIDIASSAMTDNKPESDGFIITFFWDNSGRYDTQLFISNSGGKIGLRARQNSSTWGAWKYITFS